MDVCFGPIADIMQRSKTNAIQSRLSAHSESDSGIGRSVRFSIGANGVSRFFPNGLGFNASSRGTSACATSVHLFHLAQPLSVFPRRLAELPAIFTTELRRAFVAH